MTNDREVMMFIAQSLDELLNGDEGEKQIGFILLAFPFKQRKLSYISNAEPDEIIDVLEEAIERTKSQDPEIFRTGEETLQ